MKTEFTVFSPDVLIALHAAPEIFTEIAQFKGKELGLQKTLRAKYEDHVVRAALMVTDLRKRGAAKFTRADRMWFDRTGLEQSTSELVAHYKAQRFTSDTVDICAGIGGDTLALAQRVNVLSIDREPSRGLCRTWNAKAYDVADRIEVRTQEAAASHAAGRLVHIDPDRRAGPRGRSLRIEDLEPGPEFLTELMEVAQGGAIKLSPASNFRGSFDQAEVELLSARGECKEATVWFGDLQTTDCTTRATVVETGETISGHLSYDMADVSLPQRFIFDPDPALVRSGLLDQFCLERGICRLDPEEEYVTANEVPETSFLPGTFELEAELPNDVKALRRHLREREVGRVEIKARRVPTDVEKLRRSLKLKGRGAATVLIARINRAARMLVGRRIVQ